MNRERRGRRHLDLEGRLHTLLALSPHDTVWMGVRHHLPQRACDVCVWYDAARHDVRLAVYVPSDSPRSMLGVMLCEAMLTPRQGRPARPRAVVVLERADEPAVRALADMLAIQVLAAPDRAVFARLVADLETLLGTPDVGYLDRPHSSVTEVARLYEQSRELWWQAPWQRGHGGRTLVIVEGETEPLFVRITEAPRGLLVATEPPQSTMDAVLALQLLEPAEAGPALVAEALRHRFKHLALWPVVTCPQAAHALGDGHDVWLARVVLDAVLALLAGSGAPVTVQLGRHGVGQVAWMAEESRGP